MESISVTELATQQLTTAREAQSGRAAHTVHGGRDLELRQTALALVAGRELAEHNSPGEATLHVLHGRARLTTESDAWEGQAGDFVIIPPERHALIAIEDCVVLLTVVARHPR